jgi:hypothetical protein
MDMTDDRQVANAIDGIKDLLRSEDDRTLGVLAVEANLSVLVEALATHEDTIRFQGLYTDIFLFGSEEVKHALREAIVSQAESDFHGGLCYLAADLAYGRHKADKAATLTEVGEGLIIDICERLYPELNIPDLLEAWKVSTSKRDLEFVTAQNLMTMRAVQALDEKALPFLVNTRNIKDFGRYPNVLLVAQRTQEDQTDLPSILVIFPRDDSENITSAQNAGAFYRDGQALSDLYNTSGDKAFIRLFEADSGEMVLQLTHYASERWGQLAGMAMFGHGSVNSVIFNRGKVGRLTRQLLTDSESARELAECFVPNASHVIGACNTAQTDQLDNPGFAQQYSELVRGRVTATDTSTTLHSLECVFSDEGVPSLEAVHNVGTVVFESGKLIED